MQDHIDTNAEGLSLPNTNSFNTKALSYASNSSLQLELAQILCEKMRYSLKDKTVLDLGAGSGNIYKTLKDKSFKDFIALDSAPNLLALHPKANNIKLINTSFDDFDYSRLDESVLIVSNAALQWSANLDSLLSRLSQTSCALAFSLFTKNSLKELHSHLQTTSPLRSQSEVISLIKKHFKNYKLLKSYSKTLYFQSQKELLSHLQGLGLLGGGLDSTLSYKQAKRLLNLPFLELSYEGLIFIR
ncbi:biotin synthase [Helicobacter sp. 11S02629-2]|uniref:biotin synthase n=1 Tax=Helicobacter sp. 11S02629-2 TaxID=1476195 RepID=UPI000BA7C8BB|nr:biotin synthase [Helicobacter sp. 11S02629-2]PAF45576.1 hypothetical protein BKH40_01465 [Helicobacter sp. 11S02629-2]